ncbi:MAG: sigma-54-dependent Fis family transcriptional regulator [Ignavibacteriae bacterium]|nr:sigma-54-dependent Fis family transcriptional regulator [Ignavibacteriota bacterium]
MNPFRIVLIDDEATQRDAIAGFLRKKGFDVATAASGAEGIHRAQEHHADIVLTDFKMPDLTGGDVLAQCTENCPGTPVVIMTAYGSVDGAVRLMKSGAFDYLQKPIDLDELVLVIERARERGQLLRENKALREQLTERYSFESIVSVSGEMEHVLNTAGRVAPSTAPVLVRGESGTGKELVARAIHIASTRNAQPLVVVNCAALPESLFESELFGHEKGAFTGAEKQRIGKFEQANGGTLFIDEVGDIPLPLQVKLLRAIQFGRIERLGGSESLDLDVRIVAATNRNLEEMIREGTFREDLYYRLNVVPIVIPPLRQRRADIAPLAQAFVEKYARANNKHVTALSREAMDALVQYSYPGNVRELENIVQRAVVLARDEILRVADLPGHVVIPGTAQRRDTAEEPRDLAEAVNELERTMISEALQRSGGNQVRAAEMLAISERTLRYKMQKLGLKG